jgi:hypothetical protein
LAGDTQKIYFTAGLVDESQGLFGSLTAVPEPWTWTLLTVGFGLTGLAPRTRRRTVPLGAFTTSGCLNLRVRGASSGSLTCLE